MTKEWIKRPFKLDPVPQIVVFQAIVRPVRGRGEKVTIPTFPAQSPIRLEMEYKHEREVGYFKVEKGKNKRKRDSP